MKLHRKRLTYPETDGYYFVDEPVYREHKTKRRSVYCENCGHRTGYEEYQVGVGLLGYVKKRHKKCISWFTNKSYQERVVESVFGLNALADRLRGNRK